MDLHLTRARTPRGCQVEQAKLSEHERYATAAQLEALQAQLEERDGEREDELAHLKAQVCIPGVGEV